VAEWALRFAGANSAVRFEPVEALANWAQLRVATR